MTSLDFRFGDKFSMTIAGASIAILLSMAIEPRHVISNNVAF